MLVAMSDLHQPYQVSVITLYRNYRMIVVHDGLLTRDNRLRVLTLLYMIIRLLSRVGRKGVNVQQQVSMFQMQLLTITYKFGSNKFIICDPAQVSMCCCV